MHLESKPCLWAEFLLAWRKLVFVPFWSLADETGLNHVMEGSLLYPECKEHLHRSIQKMSDQTFRHPGPAKLADKSNYHPKEDFFFALSVHMTSL